jgi:hypothetical protein
VTDWQVGDLAVCVDAAPPRNNPRVPPAIKLERGKVYTVTGIRICKNGPGLLVDDEPPHFGATIEVGWGVDRFRKIRPDEHEKCEPEFVTLLETFTRKVEAETGQDIAQGRVL